MPTPTVSIITATLNTERTIQRTIESVLNQSYPNIDYVVVDGASADGTMAIVQRYRGRIAAVISEPDAGIGDAFNKGICASKGKYIQFLNGDDFLPSNFVERAAALLERHPSAGFVFGDIVLVEPSGKETRIRGNENYHRSIKYVMRRMNHPTVVVRKSLFDEFGLFDLRWKIAMDYEWLLRIHRGGVRGVYSSELMVYMQEGGISRRVPLQAIDEVRDISIHHGCSPAMANTYRLMRLGKHALLSALGRR